MCVHQHGHHGPNDWAERCLLPSQLRSSSALHSPSLALRSQPLSQPNQLLWQLLQLRPHLRPQELWQLLGQLRHLVRQLEFLPPEQLWQLHQLRPQLRPQVLRQPLRVVRQFVRHNQLHPRPGCRPGLCFAGGITKFPPSELGTEEETVTI